MDEANGNWLTGCLLYAVGSITVNLAQVIIKLSHLDQEHGASSFWWWIGVVLFGAGDVLNVIGLNYAAQSLLEAFGSIQFVSNLCFSTFILHESVLRRHVVSTLLIVAGNVCIVAWGDHKNKKITLGRLEELAGATAFIVYISIIYPVAICIYIFETYLQRVNHRNSHERSNLQAICFVLSSAMIGANSVVVLKALSGLLHTYIQDFYGKDSKIPGKVVIGLTVVSIVGVLHISFWLYRLNLALKRYSALFVVPLMQASWIVFTVTSGGIFFGEFADLGASQILGFTCGVVLVLLGVSALIPSSRHEEISHCDQCSVSEEQVGLLHESGKLTSTEYQTVFAMIETEHVIYERLHERDKKLSCLESTNRWLDKPICN